MINISPEKKNDFKIFLSSPIKILSKLDFEASQQY